MNAFISSDNILHFLCHIRVNKRSSAIERIVSYTNSTRFYSLFMVRIHSKGQRGRALLLQVHLSSLELPPWLSTVLQRYVEECNTLEQKKTTEPEESWRRMRKRQHQELQEVELGETSSSFAVALPSDNGNGTSRRRTSSGNRRMDSRYPSPLLHHCQQELDRVAQQVGHSVLEQFTQRLKLLGGAVLCSPSSWILLGTSWEVEQPFMKLRCPTAPTSRPRAEAEQAGTKPVRPSDEREETRLLSVREAERETSSISGPLSSLSVSLLLSPEIMAACGSSSSTPPPIVLHQSLSVRVLLTSPVVLRARNCGTHSILLRLCGASIALLHQVHLYKGKEEGEEGDENSRNVSRVGRVVAEDLCRIRSVVPVSIRLVGCPSTS